MPLIKCQKCNAIVNTSDDLCPNCGEMFSQFDDRYMKLWKFSFPTYWIWPFILVIAVLSAFVFVILNHESVMDNLSKVFSATMGNVFNVAFFFVILSFFLWGFVVFRKQVRKTRRALDVASKYLYKVDMSTLSRNFEELDRNFRNDDYFGVQWCEFEETLKKVKTSDGFDYYNTIDVAAFFNEDSLFFNRFLSSFIFSIPTLLTGIGIFGTFFGLVVGLQPFQFITDFSDSKEMSRLTTQLLSGISTSFLSSLWGIFFSLVLNFILSHAKSGICNEIESFTERLEAIFPRHLSVEGEGLLEINLLLQKNTQALEALVNKIEKIGT